MNSLRERVSTGLWWGIRYGIVFSCIAVTSLLARGWGVLAPYHLTLVGMVALYLSMGLIGGVLFGLLMPLGRALLGAVVLGMLVALPVAFLLVAVMSPADGYRKGEFLWDWIGISLLGPVCGAAFWVLNQRRSR
jgi:hypothetical protein